jgi:hypothetical protein
LSFCAFTQLGNFDIFLKWDCDRNWAFISSDLKKKIMKRKFDKEFDPILGEKRVANLFSVLGQENYAIELINLQCLSRSKFNM